MPSGWVGRQASPAPHGAIAGAPQASPRAPGRLQVPTPLNPKVTQTSGVLVEHCPVASPCETHGSPSPGGLRQISEFKSQTRPMLVSHRLPSLTCVRGLKLHCFRCPGGGAQRKSDVRQTRLALVSHSLDTLHGSFTCCAREQIPEPPIGVVADCCGDGGLYGS